MAEKKMEMGGLAVNGIEVYPLSCWVASCDLGDFSFQLGAVSPIVL